MKISCQSCQAKYTIADEKVLGKIVKIRCKKCGATIVINGNDPEATASAPSHDSNHVLDYASNEQWTVNVAEGDQRTMTLAEIAQEYRTGTVNDETFCWKDGMNDWLPIREIEALYAACTMGPGALSAQPDFSPSSSRGIEAPHDDHADAGFGGGIFGSPASAETNGNGAALFGSGSPAPGSTSSPSVARRSGGRGNNQADLFGTAAQAGGEDDVMTSAPVAAATSDAGKLTGQRNENSVLFSLNALTTKPARNEPPPNQTTAKGDGSGLIDIRALSNAASIGDASSSKTSKHVDDIMNLGGGGAFSAALAAPILAPPPTETGADYGTPGQASSNKVLYAIIGGCALVAVSIIVVAIMITGGKSKSDDTASTSPTTSSLPTTATASTAPAATDTSTAATAAASSTAAAPGTGAVASRPSTGGTGGGARTGAGRPSSGGATGGNDTAPAPPPTTPSRPADLAGAMNAAVGNPTPPPAPAAPAGGSAPFDRGAAAGSLGGINVASCKKPDGPTGSGHVKVTFQPSGNVSTVEVDQPPFAGSSVGGCVAGKFRSAHVPPFAGGPVTVGKSFSIN